MAKKAGGGASHIPVEHLENSSEGSDQATSQMIRQNIDRIWAIEIIKKAAEGSTHCHYFLAHLRDEISQKAAAEKLDISEGAFKVGFHRFKKRFLQRLREEIARTVNPDPKAIEEELRYLMTLFAKSDP